MARRPPVEMRVQAGAGLPACPRASARHAAPKRGGSPEGLTPLGLSNERRFLGLHE